MAAQSPHAEAPGERIACRDPASGESLGSVPVAGAHQIEAAVREAARVQPLWALMRVRDRARYMRRVAQALIDERDQLLGTVGAEQARPAAELLTLELLPALDALIWIAEAGWRALAMQNVGMTRAMFPVKRGRVAFEPFGVIGVIGAGSAPLAQPLGQIAGALIAGNGVVFKPARRAALAGEAIARLLARAGLPEGLVQVVHGGAPAGVALAQAPVDKVLFTGSPPVGRAVARACVSRDMEVTVELGGKDAMLVLDDASLQRAAACALWAGTAAAGQARGAIERIYVARQVYEPFLRQLAGEAVKLRVGDPRDPATQLGPLASRRRLQHVQELVDQATAAGARVLCGGAPVAGIGPARASGGLSADAIRALSSDTTQGLSSNATQAPSSGVLAGQPPHGSGWSAAYYPPTVLAEVDHEMAVMREPVCGPVLAVMPVDSIDEAIGLANDSRFSLGASVWSADRYRALRIARELEAGMVWLNDHLPAPAIARGPWGAFAGGGLGKTLGLAGLRACAQEKLITHDPAGARGLWWGPYDALAERAAGTLVRLRSVRSEERERALRHGAVALARVGARALAGR